MQATSNANCTTTDWHLELAYDAPSTIAVADPSIDDPVNDTGLGPRRGDLQLVR